MTLRTVLSAGRLAGPIFEKEMRVAGRRRRSCALQCAYVILLISCIGVTWVMEVPGSRALTRVQMERAARMITGGIVCFQFFGAQLAALIIMSTSICEEVYRGTLSVLLTTPLSGWKVVMGKFSSGLFQILLLIATSLPLLAVVRVFGGVPWDYVIAGLCLTAATAIFVGSVGTFFSAACRQAYVVVVAGTLSIGLVFGLVPVLSGAFAITAWECANPYALLLHWTDSIVSPRRPVTVPLKSAVSCCTLLLLGATLLLSEAAGMVRRVALRRAMGEPVQTGRRRPGGCRAARAPATRPTRDLRRVVGPPMIWKEWTCASTHRQRLIDGLEVLIILIVCSSWPLIREWAQTRDETHMTCLWAFLAPAMLFTVVSSASVIGAEKESRTWAVLLLTPLTDREILAGKLAGVLRRCGIIWLALPLYVVAFTCARVFHPVSLVQVILITVPVVLFLSATGFYCGARCRRTTEAVMAAVVLAGGLWGVITIIGSAAMALWHGDWTEVEPFVSTFVPFGQVLAMIETALAGADAGFWWRDGVSHVFDITLLLFASMLAYLLVSCTFLRRAARTLRRNIV